MKIFRGDTREPATIIKSQGFFAKQPMTLADAKKHLLEYCGLNKSIKTPLDLSRYIISSPKPLYISTDPSEDCGGYSEKGYIYKIEIPKLDVKEFSEAVLGSGISVKANKFNPILYLNANTLQEASIIALKHYGNVTNEVTFLTSIPLEFITEYKKSGDSSFVKISTGK